MKMGLVETPYLWPTAITARRHRHRTCRLIRMKSMAPSTASVMALNQIAKALITGTTWDASATATLATKGAIQTSVAAIATITPNAVMPIHAMKNASLKIHQGAAVLNSKTTKKSVVKVPHSGRTWTSAVTGI